MCYADNSADHVTQYLNAQYDALWCNATACVKKLNPQRQPDKREHRYAFALARYFYGKHRPGSQPSLQDLMFHASFGKPSLQFICNHEALLHLSIIDGHYNTDFGKALPNHLQPAKPNRNQALKDVRVTFRVPFHLTSIRGGIPMVGNVYDGISLLVLDFPAATFYHMSSSVAESARQTITFYLEGYLRLLQSAGHHALFCLPNFDDAGLRYTVDFSASAETFADVEAIHGVSTQKINEYLLASWRNALLFSATSDGPSSDGTGLGMAEYRSTWSSRNFGVDFEIEFATPEVKALCDQEVVIIFNIERVSFYENTDFELSKAFETFTDWKFAFLSTVAHEKAEDGSVVRFSLDVSSCRYMKHFSLFPNYDASKDTRGLYSRLSEFFISEYFARMRREELHIVYDRDAIFESPSALDNDNEIFDDAEDGTEAELESDDDESDQQPVGPDYEARIIRQEASRTSDVGEFDIITAISQSSVNRHFRSAWESARTKEAAWSGMLKKWTHHELFEATFKPLTIQLLSNDSAIISIRMEEGFLRVGTNGLSADIEQHPFSNWQLGFEVPLLKCQHSQVPGATSMWSSRFENSAAYKEHGIATDRDYQHIYADLTAAHFVPECSRFNGLISNMQRQSATKVQALISLLREKYFPQLMAAGYHVVHTIPTWKNSASLPPWAHTDIEFHVASDTTVTRKTQKARLDSSEPVIVILGMTAGRPMPPAAKIADWMVRLGRTLHCGAVCLSRNIFLNPTVLRLFASVNASTTLIPFFTGVNGPNWGLRLVPWSKDEDRKNQSSDFKLEEDLDLAGGLRYKWQHQARWTYEQLGSSWSSQQKYIAYCNTENRLVIPTTFKQGVLEIRMEGRVKLHIGYGVEEPDHWTADSAVSWSSSLFVHTHRGSLYVSVDSTPPVYEQVVIKGNPIARGCNPEELLKKHFPYTPDLADVAAEFHQFEAPWKSSYPGDDAFNLTQPAFNRCGDLLFELRPYCSRGPLPTNLHRKADGVTNPSVQIEGSTAPHTGMPFISPFTTYADQLLAESPEYAVQYGTYPNGNGRLRVNHSRGQGNGRATPSLQSPGNLNRFQVFEGYNVQTRSTNFEYIQRSRGPTPVPSRPATPLAPYFPGISPEMPMPKRTLSPFNRPASVASSMNPHTEVQFASRTSPLSP
ncbi:hypothetical protein BC835DRAFT_323570 [Cytidiella melzeri]|nr:hypothetical protein BC835DRAFT_323570 [Cytidiella melzeri]